MIMTRLITLDLTVISGNKSRLVVLLILYNDDVIIPSSRTEYLYYTPHIQI